MINIFLKLIKDDKSSNLTYTQRIQINMKNWHAQQLDLDDREVFSILPVLFVFVCVHESLADKPGYQNNH